MSANLTLIDDLGNVWNGASPRLRKAFGSLASTDEFSTYAVKNLGFIAVHCYGRSCEIRHRPRLVTPPALNALIAWLKERDFDRVVAAHFDTDWRYGLFAGKDAALAKIEKLIGANREQRIDDRLTRQIPKDELPRATPLHQALHSLIENWPMLSQSVHRDALWSILRHSLDGRFHIMDCYKGTHELVFREIGHGFVSYSDRWMSRAIGSAVEDQEDAAYGRWLAAHCKAALQVGEPSVWDIDAIMSTAKLGRARLRYKRVLLPARGAGGGVWLLSSSILDPSIDLRLNLLDKSA